MAEVMTEEMKRTIIEEHEFRIRCVPTTVLIAEGWTLYGIAKFLGKPDMSLGTYGKDRTLFLRERVNAARPEFDAWYSQRESRRRKP
jgi:hypothetical protein